jgi:hypothetical membrane protein
MKPKTVGIIGILGSVIPIAAIFTAILLSPWFSWTHSWLSDLGGSDKPVAPIMNYGLIIGGVLGMAFALGLWKLGIFKGDESDFGIATLFLSSFFLCFVGLLPVDVGMPHTIASFLFFVLAILTLILLGRVIIRSGERKFGYVVLALGILCVISFPFFFVERPWGSNAIIEMVTTSALSAFVFFTSIDLIRKETVRK